MINIEEEIENNVITVNYITNVNFVYNMNLLIFLNSYFSILKVLKCLSTYLYCFVMISILCYYLNILSAFYKNDSIIYYTFTIENI